MIIGNFIIYNWECLGNVNTLYNKTSDSHLYKELRELLNTP